VAFPRKDEKEQKQQDQDNGGLFHVCRRIATAVPVHDWESVLNIRVPVNEKTLLAPAETVVGPNHLPNHLPLKHASSSSSSSSSTSTTSSNGRRFPQGGGKTQRSAWYSDDYLISIDPPACGIGNKFFIYSAYRIYSSIFQKEMNIHNANWLAPAVYKLSLSSSSPSLPLSTTATLDRSRRYQMMARVPTNEDRALIEAVFQKTTMYLQWSPLVLSWQKDVQAWFAPFVADSIEKSIEEIEEPRDLKITIIGRDGEEKIQSTPLDENFSVKKAFRFE
jgi:hypothetical protein